MAGGLFADLIFSFGTLYPLQVVIILLILLIVVGIITVKKYKNKIAGYKDWLRLFIFLSLGFVGVAYFLYYINYSSF